MTAVLPLSASPVEGLAYKPVAADAPDQVPTPPPEVGHGSRPVLRVRPVRDRVAASNDWVDERWLVTMDFAVALIFLMSAAMNRTESLTGRYAGSLLRDRVAEQPLIDEHGTRIVGIVQSRGQA
ncbi:MAG: hypothetical protein WAW88_10370 [Nocardioides sp.]